MDGGLTTVIRDDEVEAGEKVLHFRFRAFLTVALLLVITVSASLFVTDKTWSRVAEAAANIIFAFGVPWLAWHLRVPFSARVTAPILQFTGLYLNGRDPRGDLWSLADLPVIFFLFGWLVDISLRNREGRRSIVGRLLFSCIWVYLAQSTFTFVGAGLLGWIESILILLGGAIVWIPREKLARRNLGTSKASEEIVAGGMRSAGGWLARRVGIGVLILLPTLIYLDLLELPPLLRAEMGEDSDTTSLFWVREVRRLQDADLEKLEVLTAAPDATESVIDAIRSLRRDPSDAASLEALRGLQQSRISSLALLETFRGSIPVYYVEILPGGNQRATAGIFSVADHRWDSWDELRRLAPSDIANHTRQVHKATVIVLVNGILILLLLGGTSGGSATAWWLAIFLAGTNMGWAGDSLDFLTERVRYVLWRDYSELHSGGPMFGLHSLLLFFSQAAEWLALHQVVQAGLWVSLCWPAAPGRLIRSNLDRFWLQAAKILALSLLLYGYNIAFFFLTGGKQGWVIGWFLLTPIALVGVGFLQRRRISHRLSLPVIGKLAAAAFVLRGWVPLLAAYDSNWPLPGDYGRLVTYSAILLAIAVAVMWILALERGTFLSPPHVQGQLWLIGIAALPFIESVVGDPVSSLLEESGLFLGTAVGWLAFGAAVWLIGPIFSFLGERLSRWRARGLCQIEELHERILEEMEPGSSESWVDPFEECHALFSRLDTLEPEIWRHCGKGEFSKISPDLAGTNGEKLMSSALASRLAEVEGSLRLEEMRGEWKWAAFYPELERFFLTKGDLLLIPASYEGKLVGLFCALDAPRNRFLLRPAVSTALARLLATAIVFETTPKSPSREIQTFAPAV